MQTQEYKDYLRSAEWKQKKQERMEIDGFRCVMCGRPLNKIKSIQEHHITYARLGHENVMTDICTLCGSCHQKIHNYYNRKRK